MIYDFLSSLHNFSTPEAFYSFIDSVVSATLFSLICWFLLWWQQKPTPPPPRLLPPRLRATVAAAAITQGGEGGWQWKLWWAVFFILWCTFFWSPLDQNTEQEHSNIQYLLLLPLVRAPPFLAVSIICFLKTMFLWVWLMVELKASVVIS